ncbi:hypothetical protein CUJ83_13670 [Methanocella sp. CWC-04]|uniref:Uncharacterized protein n=1 Tax=Methanooceanicella nereidis TaxID=2052831 RepID=A0AAP2RFD3_9EURY|nr:hypothetical protein [Methanocella sp. CWC-04]MCD1296047.1 hypothetical protein [Methanocella sp. CWC-04]
MNTVSFNAKQILGIFVGIFVVIAGIVVNMQKFGNDISIGNIAVIFATGILVVISMIVVGQD